MKRLYFFLLLLALVVVSAAFQKPAAVESQSNGRFQIVINPNVRADTFLLDTHTGKVWTFQKIPGIHGDYSVWEFNDRVDDKRQISEWVKDKDLK